MNISPYGIVRAVPAVVGFAGTYILVETPPDVEPLTSIYRLYVEMGGLVNASA